MNVDQALLIGFVFGVVITAVIVFVAQLMAEDDGGFWGDDL